MLFLCWQHLQVVLVCRTPRRRDNQVWALYAGLLISYSETNLSDFTPVSSVFLKIAFLCNVTRLTALYASLCIIHVHLQLVHFFF
jgi:hypothetical protein